MALPPTLSVPEAAAVLGVNPRTVYNAIDSNQCPSIRVGRAIKIPTGRFLTAYELESDLVAEKFEGSRLSARMPRNA
jgi:excisionase family DNA binding protein